MKSLFTDPKFGDRQICGEAGRSLGRSVKDLVADDDYSRLHEWAELQGSKEKVNVSNRFRMLRGNSEVASTGKAYAGSRRRSMESHIAEVRAAHSPETRQVDQSLRVQPLSKGRSLAPRRAWKWIAGAALMGMVYFGMKRGN